VDGGLNASHNDDVVFKPTPLPAAAAITPAEKLCIMLMQSHHVVHIFIIIITQAETRVMLLAEGSMLLGFSVFSIINISLSLKLLY
jgi:hypothetical protein